MTEIRRVDEAGFEEYLALREVAFPSRLTEEAMRRVLLRRLPHTWGLYRQGVLACACAVYPMTMFLTGQVVPFGALSGVASALESRRRGLVRQLLLAMLEQMRFNGTGWCLEYPFDPRFYERLGWGSIPNGVVLDLPPAALFSEPPQGVRRVPLESLESLALVHERWARNYTFVPTRRDDPRGSWARLTDREWLEGEALLYSHGDEGYVLLKMQRESRNETVQTLVEVIDYAFASPVARRVLLGLLGSFSGQADLIRLQVPPDDPLALDYFSRHARTGRSPLQARIVDLGAALAPFTADEEWTLTLRLKDPLCDWNDGIFRLTAGPQGTQVDPVSTVDSDVSMPVHALPKLLAGIPARTLAASGLVEGDLASLHRIASLSSGYTTFQPLADAF